MHSFTAVSSLSLTIQGEMLTPMDLAAVLNKRGCLRLLLNAKADCSPGALVTGDRE